MIEIEEYIDKINDYYRNCGICISYELSADSGLYRLYKNYGDVHNIVYITRHKDELKGYLNILKDMSENMVFIIHAKEEKLWQAGKEDTG